MIRITQIKLPLDCKDEKAALLKKAAGLLRVETDCLQSLSLVKKSIDARKKPDIYRVYTVDVKVADESRVLKRSGSKNGQIQLVEETAYHFPAIGGATVFEGSRPIIVGTGPAGLFCGYMLAGPGIALFCWREAGKYINGLRMWNDSGRRECWIRIPTFSSVRAEPAPFQTEN